jgi:hypothetical protein
MGESFRKGAGTRAAGRAWRAVRGLRRAPILPCPFLILRLAAASRPFC